MNGPFDNIPTASQEATELAAKHGTLVFMFNESNGVETCLTCYDYKGHIYIMEHRIIDHNVEARK